MYHSKTQPPTMLYTMISMNSSLPIGVGLVNEEKPPKSGDLGG